MKSLHESELWKLHRTRPHALLCARSTRWVTAGPGRPRPYHTVNRTARVVTGYSLPQSASETGCESERGKLQLRDRHQKESREGMDRPKITDVHWTGFAAICVLSDDLPGSRLGASALCGTSFNSVDPRADHTVDRSSGFAAASATAPNPA
jgi:hypothetical protein